MERPKIIALIGLGYVTALVALCVARGDREIAYLLLAHLASSLVALLLYGLDKSAAQAHRERTPEATLHLVALLGGWPGAAAGQVAFRHKTKKEPFRSVFLVTVIANLVGSIGFVLSQLQIIR